MSRVTTACGWILSLCARVIASFKYTSLRSLQVILLGGEYRPDRMDNVGPLANTTLGELHGYHAFISADGLNREVGLMASDVESAYIFRLAVANAKETTLLADHTKFHANALCKIVGWDRVSRVVTDHKPDEEWTTFFEEQNIEVIHPAGITNGEIRMMNQ